MTRFLPDEEARSLCSEQLTAVESIVRTIPAYTLHFNLAGKFWEEMERLLHGLYKGLANTGLFRKLLPFKFRPRVYVFKFGKRSFFNC